jgi:hypothetical protein
LLVIALPAAVAIWSGWVGLGGMCGFGPVNLLPGLGGGLTVNTAITLPVGVEAYAAFALGAWLAPQAPARARAFAGWSALGALAYGMAGQVVYHLLVSRGYVTAPAPVVVLVSCMPVAVLGFAAALTHLLTPAHAPRTGPVLPSLRELQRDYDCGMPVARKIQAGIAAHTAESPAGVSAGASGRDATPPPGVPAALNGHGGPRG